MRSRVARPGERAPVGLGLHPCLWWVTGPSLTAPSVSRRHWERLDYPTISCKNGCCGEKGGGESILPGQGHLKGKYENAKKKKEGDAKLFHQIFPPCSLSCLMFPHHYGTEAR